MRSRFLAGLMSAAVLLSAHAVAAQDAGALNDAEASPNQDQGAALLAHVTSQLHDLLRTLGYEGTPKMSGLTAEMFAASIPYTSAQDIIGTADVAIGLGVKLPEASRIPPERTFERSTGNSSSLSDDEERFASTQGYVLLNDAAECEPADGRGKVASFRRFTSGDTQGHLCVVVSQDDTTGVWQAQARSAAVAGEQRARSYYAVRVGVEGDAGGARLLGEPRLDAIIRIGNVLSKYTMALAELDQQDWSDDEALAAWQRFEESIKQETGDSARQAEAGYVEPPDITSAKFRANIVDSLGRLTETLGLDVPEIEVGLTVPTIQASFAGRWTNGLKGSDFTAQFRGWTPSAAEPDRPQDFTLLSEEATCQSSIKGGGRMVGFRRLSLDQVAEGHQCVGVWASDDGSAWTLVSHSVSLAGHIAVLSTYQITVKGEAGTDTARLFGEEGQGRMVALASLLADYGLATSAASFQTWASQYSAQPPGIITRLKERLLVGVSSGAATVITD